MRFKDRKEAGVLLAQKLIQYKESGAVVYAIPRGGVVLGVEIARVLVIPLDLVIVRKIGHPNNSEYAVCVVAEDHHFLCNPREKATLDPKWLVEAVENERREAVRRSKVYWGDRPRPSALLKTAIVVDDGVATGMTFLVALNEVRHLKPAKLVAAIPVLPAEMVEKIKAEADEVVYLDAPEDFAGAVGSYYDNFPQVEDEEVIKLLTT
ncbi:phosphoribosyl transferase [Candidatus Collierbacteria bacterium RIFCSPLOWO2_01_FULL_50_23]|uniref:Phosphoribosyl transferase n=2 Tax=Candidatus Collieribacteriota TaxID=1752725 RepID=A0A1F5EVC5_9BACT|nr:MAG: phosphoribosyl transferase [Candidatus Collierbacteria bacterium RIFCSPHIGHO2_02_FULL_49_10]OGD71451.1 MAG: phosphoribosyl transferase [Candidatus Collierbacteria bacterium RIFCSPHIGHO2_01_FULL_50_25]OGD74529.1 MAG: phosphoribosyl transferase [Candidatus Collierbacteria bacterium RIFCSPLOWO2_01_FULL_50_23]